MAKNTSMTTAKKNKNDEFYTRYEDIEAEIMRYKEQFKNKVVLCNCDDPEWSNFWQFFHRNFSFFELKKLISTHYVESGSSFAQIYDGTRDKKVPLTRSEKIANNEKMDLFDKRVLESNGDFRSKECLKYLEEADIVVTNPPFSLFREFVSTLEGAGKKYLVIGSKNAITYKEIFPLIKDNKLWLGYGFGGGNAYFRIPAESSKEYAKGVYNEETGLVKFRNVCWFTNLDTTKRHEELILWKEYNEKEYPKYDNYDAINIDKTDNIPCDYFGYMGVPITFLDKYNPEQFEVLDARNCTNIERLKEKSSALIKDADGSINGKAVYVRVVIRRKYDNDGNPIK